MFFARAKLEARLTWMYDDKALTDLRVVVFNTGHRKTILQDIGIQVASEGDHVVGIPEIDALMPIVLDVDEATPAILFPARISTRKDALGVALIDHHKRRTLIDLPPKADPKDFDRLV